MTSKLFRAVVGVGIALGTASGACLGAIDSVPEADDASTTTTPQPDGASTPKPTPSADAGADAAADADADAPLDAPKDVILDAFCDATWPTTKGNVHAPTCGPTEECEDAGPAPRCYYRIEGSDAGCNVTKPIPAWCVSAAWQCSTGAVPVSQCKCFGPPCL